MYTLLLPGLDPGSTHNKSLFESGVLVSAPARQSRGNKVSFHRVTLDDLIVTTGWQLRLRDIRP